MGSFLDPMADKVLIATLFGALTYMDLIPGRFLSDKFTLLFIAGTIISALLFVAVYLTGAIITRDLLLVAAAFCVRYKSLPPPVSTLHSSKIAVCMKRGPRFIRYFLISENAEPVLRCDSCNSPALPNGNKQVEYRYAVGAGCNHTGSPCLRLRGSSHLACHVVRWQFVLVWLV